MVGRCVPIEEANEAKFLPGRDRSLLPSAPSEVEYEMSSGGAQSSIWLWDTCVLWIGRTSCVWRRHELTSAIDLLGLRDNL